MKAKVKARNHFRFGDQDIIEDVITFRIDSRTIKEGALKYDCGYHVPLGSYALH